MARGGLFRASVELVTCLVRSDEVFARPGLKDKLEAVASQSEPFAIPGPTREQLLELVS